MCALGLVDVSVHAVQFSVASKLVNLTLKHERSVAARQSSQVHWCEHLSPMWTLAQMWHTGSGHMQAFHPSSLHSYWCCEYTSHDCWLWQHSDSHNPSQKIGPSSFSPGQARPSPHKTLIDLMDLCAVHTPSPNTNSPPKICLHWDKEAVPALLSLKQHSATAWEGSVGLPNLLISLLGLGEGLSMLCDDSSYCKSRLPPPFFYQLPGQPELTQVHRCFFLFFFFSLHHSQECWGQSWELRCSFRGRSLKKSRCTTEAHNSCFYQDWLWCSTPRDLR